MERSQAACTGRDAQEERRVWGSAPPSRALSACSRQRLALAWPATGPRTVVAARWATQQTQRRRSLGRGAAVWRWGGRDSLALVRRTGVGGRHRAAATAARHGHRRVGDADAVWLAFTLHLAFASPLITQHTRTAVRPSQGAGLAMARILMVTGPSPAPQRHRKSYAAQRRARRRRTSLR